MADERINPDLCTGCGTCVDICPNDVLRMDEEKGIAAVRYPQDCSFCGFCYANCPTGAITDAPGVMGRPLVAW